MDSETMDEDTVFGGLAKDCIIIQIFRLIKPDHPPNLQLEEDQR